MGSGGGAAASGAAMLNPATAAATAIPAIYQGITGLKQSADAKKIEKTNVRPEFRTPEQIQEALGLSRVAYNDPRLAGYTNALNQLGANVANASQTARDIGGGTASQLAAMQGAQNVASQGAVNLGIAGAQQQQQDMARLQNRLDISGEYANKEWEWNRQQPYMDAAAAASALREGGQRNTFAALNNLASTALNTSFGQNNGQSAKKTPSDLQNIPSMQSQPLVRTIEEIGFTSLPSAAPNPIFPNSIFQPADGSRASVPNKFWGSAPEQRPMGYGMEAISPMTSPIPQRQMLPMKDGGVIRPEEYEGLNALLNYGR